MRTRRAFLRGALGVGGGILLASCAPSAPTAPGASPAGTGAAAGSPKRGGTLTVVMTGNPISHYDPADIPYYEERKALRAVYDPLIALGDDGQPLAARSLAERWEFTDPRTFVLHLRKGVKFHDGTPWDAAAAKFNLDRHLDPAVRSSAASELAPVSSIDVVDTSTIKINLKSPTVAFPVTLFDRSAYQISPTAWQKHGKEKYWQNPVGTGPYKLVEVVPGDRSTLERNPDYWASPMPYTDKLVLRTIPDDATRLNELRTGGAQIADGLPYQDIERIKQMPEVVLQNQVFRLEFLRWNVDSTYGKSKELRQAFQYAIDREAIRRTVYSGTGEVAYDPFFPGTPFSDPNYKPFPRDVDKAKALLDKSGLPSPLKFTYYVSEDPVRQREAQVYQQSLKDVGVTIDIQTEQVAAWNARFNRGDYQFGNTWWGWRPDPYFYMPIFQSGGANFAYFQPGQWKDPTFDGLVTDAVGEQSVDKRKSIYRQAAERLNDGAAWVFYRYGPIYVGANPKVKGYTDPKSTIADYAKVWLE